MSSGLSATNAEPFKGTCLPTALDLAASDEGFTELVVQIVKETWKNELSNEIKTRELLAQEVKDESLKRAKLAEELSQISKDRIASETEIVASVRKLMEQGAAFQSKVCRNAASEAVEQRTVLAREIRSDLEATLEDRITDLRLLLERNTTILNNRCDACDDRSAVADKKLAALREELNVEVNERKHLRNRLNREEDHYQNSIATFQQQMTDLRESLRLDVQEKQASEDRVSSLIASVQAWQEKSSQAFDKQQSDVSTLREHMTDHLSWVAKHWESELSQLRAQVLRLVDQTKGRFSQVATLQESEHMARVDDTNPRAWQQPSQIASVSRSSSSARLRPVSPVRNMPQPPVRMPQLSSSSSHSTLIGDDSMFLSAGIARTLPKPPDIGTPGSQGGIQRTHSAGLLSARFSGPPRNSRQT